MKVQHGKKWMPAMYVAYFGMIEEVMNEHGYALCIHGSVTRDFDLVAIPFEEKIAPHKLVLDRIREIVGLAETDALFDVVGMEPHGRTCYTIPCGGGGYFDISFTPTLDQLRELERRESERKDEIKSLLLQIRNPVEPKKPSGLFGNR